LVATVSRGRLVGLRYGQCNATAIVSADEVEIARREGILDLHMEASLGAGIPLVTEAWPHRDETTIVLEDPSPSAS
jgi:hypothetical protein